MLRVEKEDRRAGLHGEEFFDTARWSGRCDGKYAQQAFLTMVLIQMREIGDGEYEK